MSNFQGGQNGSALGSSSSRDTSKPSAPVLPHPGGGRLWTLSVAIAASVLGDCMTATQRAVTASRIARALAIFSVDEVIVYDDCPGGGGGGGGSGMADVEDDGMDNPAQYLGHVLSFLEAPPFMRKRLFGLHPNLRLSGSFPSLDMPHHPNPLTNDWLPFREGLSLREVSPDGGSLVDIGAGQPVVGPPGIPPNLRVTVLMSDPADPHAFTETVSPRRPRVDMGYYWGYSVRLCDSISAVWTESVFRDGYTCSIGTSERGRPVGPAMSTGAVGQFRASMDSHLLVVFGGPRGIESAVANDPVLSGHNKLPPDQAWRIFDDWVNILPGQGSRTIRTDEAILIGLTVLRGMWYPEL